MKIHLQSLQKVSEADQYMVHNLMWSVVYLRSTFSNTIIQKILTLAPLTATVPGVFFSTMTIFLSESYYALEEALTHMKSIKLKSYPGGGVADFCAEILVYSERIESAGKFKPEHLGCITCIFEDTPDSRFRLWNIQNFKEVA